MTGKVINQVPMRSMITKMLLDLGHQYKIEFQKIIEYCDCGDYLKKADQYRNEKTKKSTQVLDLSVERKINYIMKKEEVRYSLKN